MIKHFWPPSKPENHFYIEYVYYDSRADEIYEFWCDTIEEFNEKLTFLQRHARYSVIKSRWPLTITEKHASL